MEFMIAERQNRIDENIHKMRGISFEINKIKTEYNRILSEIALLNKETLEVQEQIQVLEMTCEKYKDESFLYYKSECIQSLSESIEKKEKQIQFTKCLKTGNSYDKKIPAFINGFKQFYKHENYVQLEELGEGVSFISVVFRYMKQYMVLKKNKLSVFEPDSIMQSLISKYEIHKENMLIELNSLTEELEQRKRYLRNYPKNRAELEARLEEIKAEINKLYGLFDCELLMKKNSEFDELRKENQIYQSQIDGLLEIGSKKQEKSLRRVA